jgi:hypothetical protein
MSGPGPALADVIFFLAATVITITVLIFLIGGNAEDLLGIVATESADVVARDLSSFITVTAAAPYKISINFVASSTKKYDVTIQDRVTTVIATVLGRTRTGKSGSAVDPSEKYQQVSTFEIGRELLDRTNPARYVYDYFVKAS